MKLQWNKKTFLVLLLLLILGLAAYAYMNKGYVDTLWTGFVTKDWTNAAKVKAAPVVKVIESQNGKKLCGSDYFSHKGNGYMPVAIGYYIVKDSSDLDKMMLDAASKSGFTLGAGKSDYASTYISYKADNDREVMKGAGDRMIISVDRKKESQLSHCSVMANIDLAQDEALVSLQVTTKIITSGDK